jgi:drug/metabolite transporter (DMT)-like permease
MIAVLGAAFMHALWNSLIKVGTARMGAMVILSLGEIPIGLAVLACRPALDWSIAPWVLAAGAAHFFYKFFLTYAYERGDLSRVYPIARGAAPLIVGLVSGFVLADVISPAEYAGIVVLGAGIVMMAQGVLTSGENRRLIPYALGSACATATYTLIDGTGARISGDAVAYIAWVFVADGLIFSTIMIGWKGLDIIPRDKRAWGLGLFASAASYGSYAVSVWAMTIAPIAVVAALRETSILFAVLIGWLVFGEAMTRGKALAALIIVGGVMLTRIG